MIQEIIMLFNEKQINLYNKVLEITNNITNEQKNSGKVHSEVINGRPKLWFITPMNFSRYFSEIKERYPEIANQTIPCIERVIITESQRCKSNFYLIAHGVTLINKDKLSRSENKQMEIISNEFSIFRGATLVKKNIPEKQTRKVKN